VHDVPAWRGLTQSACERAILSRRSGYGSALMSRRANLERTMEDQTSEFECNACLPAYLTLAEQVPGPAKFFPVPRKDFPVNCLGNCARSHGSAAVSSHGAAPRRLKIAEFPVKFPVSREFARRRVRSALRRQGGSLVRARTFRFVFSWHPVARPKLHVSLRPRTDLWNDCFWRKAAVHLNVGSMTITRCDRR
jgi:hypothetical protein